MRKLVFFFIFLLTVFLIRFLIFPTEPMEKAKIESPQETLSKKIIPKEKKIEKPRLVKSSEPPKFPPIPQGNKAHYQQIKNLRSVILKQWDELQECESEFDLLFGEYFIQNRDFEKKPLTEEEISDIAEKLDNFVSITPSSSEMIVMLGQEINKDIDPKVIIETVGFVKYCREAEQDFLIRLLFSTKTQNKDMVAKAAFTLIEKRLSMLTYIPYYQNLVYEIKSLASFIGTETHYEEEFVTLENKIRKHFSLEYEENKKCSKSGYCFPAQKGGLKRSEEFQKDLQQLLQKIKEDLP